MVGPQREVRGQDRGRNGTVSEGDQAGGDGGCDFVVHGFK